MPSSGTKYGLVRAIDSRAESIASRNSMYGSVAPLTGELGTAWIAKRTARRQRREVVVAAEDLARGIAAGLGERGLQQAHDGPSTPHVGLPPVPGLRSITRPRLTDADTARERGHRPPGPDGDCDG